MTDVLQTARPGAVTVEDVQIAMHALKRELLTALWSEITTMSAVSDDDLVRIIGCFLELAPHATSLARAVEIDVGALTAVTSMTKSSGVIEIASADRNPLLRRMYFEVIRQIGVLEQAA